MAVKGKTIDRKKRKKKNTKGSLILIVLLFVLGIGVLLYPTISDLWNSHRSNQLVTVYQSKVDHIPETRIREELRKARSYNRQHTSNVVADAFTKDKYMIEHPYDDLLNPTDNGVMGYLEIPRIQQKLAIFHGTSAKVLEKGVGHVKGTSLPIGGKGTHAVLAAHRGLPSAKLFSDLDKMEVGDKFYLTVLNRHLAYQVDQIRVVSPKNMEELAIQKGRDYVTLLTCTPYGVNTHRLLVRGHRVPYQTHKPIRSPLSKLLHSWQFWLSAGAVSAAFLTGATKKKRRGRMRKG
ncbi:class C sortase [Hornefia butyriciproducens]|uniref:Class C sortase n=1 Tax=Hornefia butyriciproducens TaxID=2652293 RepID=A0A6L5Y776_9FIRM|nr:class C sortase [Hornefia butyriciproducens]MST52540.1 class C sortase [Hornefia butyriciproducens]